MNDTRMTIVGTALTKPERKVLEKSGTVVANFRVISNSRRMDRGSNTWVDGPHFRIKVNCWRRMADHVVASINAGDPVFVHGRVSTREWKTETGEPRMSYELDAECVGHDLSRGVDVFTKMRFDAPYSVVDDEEAENRVNGEPTHTAASLTLGADELYGSGDDEAYPDSAADALAMLRDAGLDPTPGDDSSDEEDNDEEELVGATAGAGGAAGRSRRRGRATEPA